MGMNMILTIIAGIVMTTMVGTQVAPSIIEQIKVKKIEVQTINNQEVIFEAIKRYITMKQVAPTTMEQLRIAGYIDAKVNDNGFGVEHIIDSEKYTIHVDKAKGVATITTRIEDPKAQEAFLNSFMGTSKPTRVGATNNFETKFVLPNEVMHGNALLMTGIPIQATPPDSNINKYWYDTSGSKVVLKIYDGTKWVKLDLGGSVSIGSIETFAGVEAKIPEGYLLCNGQEVSRTTYKDLFDVIGTTYGSTSGTTFKVPDLRGEFIRGFDNGRGVDNGRVFGSSQVDMIKSHKHDVQGIFHQYNSNLFGVANGTKSVLFNWSGKVGVTETNIGGGVETRPRNIAMNYIIKY